MTLEPKVTRVTETSSFDSTGNRLQTFLVNFTVGDHGPFSVVVPAAQFNPDEVKKKMAEVADTINKLPQG